ncbi:MAG: CubicO group peptidase (beta-lactamase class C family), partial [Bacteroidia bacterium]
MKKLLFILLVGFFSLPIYAQEIYFPPQDGNWETISTDSLGWCKSGLDSLKEFVGEKNSKAFIILKDGKIAVEWYYDNFAQDSLWYWASAGKSLMATLVGIAQSENLLSINDTTSDYLGNGWTSMELEKERQITIRNQLTMTTGLDFVIPDWDCLEPSCLKYRAEPNTQWFYHNAPYTLLKDVVEEASGQSINGYFKQKIGDKIGMKGAYISTANSNNLFFSKARDMAKFGLLTLAKGDWNEESILTDKSYFSQMTTSSQTLNLSYGYLWWLNGNSSHVLPGLPISFEGSIIPTAPADMFAALGKNDQKIYVVPSQNLVVIRLGNVAEAETFALSSFDSELWSRIGKLSDCEVVADLESETLQNFQIYPNPTETVFSIRSEFPIREIIIRNMQGKEMRKTTESKVDISNFPKGIYLLETHFVNGVVSQRKLMK